MEKMKVKSTYKTICGLSCVLASLVLISGAYADGTQELGTPSIPIAEGSQIMVAGTGLSDAQPGEITLEIPAGVSIAQVLLYWTGEYGEDDDSIIINGSVIEGPRIGGPPYDTYRADITASNFIAAGVMNVLTVNGLDFTERNNGAAIVVILDDGSTNDIQIMDGSDAAYLPEPFNEQTVPVEFPVPASADPQTGTIWLIVSDIEIPRPAAVKVTVGGITNLLDDVFLDNEGDFLDIVELEIMVPAGATNVTVQVLSIDDETSLDPASVGWHFVAWQLDPPKGCTYTIGYWKNHPEDWPTNNLSLYTMHEAMMNLWTPPKGGNAYFILAHQYIGAELNVVNGTSISDEVLDAWFSAQELLETYMDAEKIPKKSSDRDWAIDLADILDDYNNGLLGPCHCD